MVVAGQDELLILLKPGAVFEGAEVAGVGAIRPELQKAGGAEEAVRSVGGAGAVCVEPNLWEGVHEEGAAGGCGEYYGGSEHDENRGV